MRHLALVAALLLVACDHDPAAPPVQTPITGTWAVTRLNGSPLPASLGPGEQLTADQYTLTASSQTGGTFTQTFVTNTLSVVATGNWWLQGSTVSLQDNSSALISAGPWKGDTIALISGALALTLVRQP